MLSGNDLKLGLSDLVAELKRANDLKEKELELSEIGMRLAQESKVTSENAIIRYNHCQEQTRLNNE